MIDFRQGFTPSMVAVERIVAIATGTLVIGILGMVGSMAGDLKDHAIMSVCVKALLDAALILFNLLGTAVLRFFYDDTQPKAGHSIFVFAIWVAAMTNAGMLFGGIYSDLRLGITRTFGAEPARITSWLPVLGL